MVKAKTRSNRSVRRKKIRSVKRNKQQKKQAVKTRRKRSNTGTKKTRGGACDTQDYECLPDYETPENGFYKVLKEMTFNFVRGKYEINISSNTRKKIIEKLNKYFNIFTIDFSEAFDEIKNLTNLQIKDDEYKIEKVSFHDFEKTNITEENLFLDKLHHAVQLYDSNDRELNKEKIIRRINELYMTENFNFLLFVSFIDNYKSRFELSEMKIIIELNNMLNDINVYNKEQQGIDISNQIDSLEELTFKSMINGNLPEAKKTGVNFNYVDILSTIHTTINNNCNKTTTRKFINAARTAAGKETSCISKIYKYISIIKGITEKKSTDVDIKKEIMNISTLLGGLNSKIESELKIERTKRDEYIKNVNVSKKRIDKINEIKQLKNFLESYKQ